MNKDRILSKILSFIREDAAPTVNVGSGNIAGTKEAGDDPPVRKQKRYIYVKAVRKTWTPEKHG